MKRKQIRLSNEGYMGLLQDFKSYVAVSGYSLNGQAVKGSNVQEFLEWLESQQVNDIQEVTPLMIKEHYSYLQTRPHKYEGTLSAKTIIDHMNSIRLFLSVLQQERIITVHPMSTIRFEHPKAEYKQRTVLTLGEIKELFATAQTLQEKAILSLGYGCGLRAMELVGVNMEDIYLTNNLLIVPKGKGNKKRWIPFSGQIKENLRQYIEFERPLYLVKDDQKAFLLNSKGERLQKYTCRKILKKLIEKTGNKSILSKNISLHNLRHSIATHLLEQGVSVEQVQLFLGHSHLETTEIYTRVSQQQLKDLISDE